MLVLYTIKEQSTIQLFFLETWGSFVTFSWGVCVGVHIHVWQSGQLTGVGSFSAM